MDSVALLGPSIQYGVKNTFIEMTDAPPAAARARALSSPPAFHYSSTTARKRRGGRSAWRDDHKPGSPLHRKPGSRSDRAGSDCSTDASSDACGLAVRIGNLPNRAKPGRLRAFASDLGLHAAVDSIYVPLDAKTGVGKGYAFVHFSDEASAHAFMRKADGQRLPRCHSPKLMHTTIASRQAIAHIPKQMPKNAAQGRTYTAYLWLR